MVMEKEEARQKSMRVLMLPWLACGHITPFLELAKKLTHGNFNIYLCTSPVNLNFIKNQVPHHLRPNYPSNSIQLVELHLPSLPDLPPHHHTTRGLPLHLFPTFVKAVHMTKPQVSHIIQTLKPDLLIYDVFPFWVPDLTSSLNIPSVAFITSGLAFVSLMFHQIKNDHEEFPFPEISPDYLRIKFSHMRKHLPFTDDQGRDISPISMYQRSSKIILARSCRELEGKYIDYLSLSFGKKIVPVGPLVTNPAHGNEGIDIINWLNKKDKSSTVFVSFGSEHCLDKEDMEEIAHGLELSKVNFIWVVRFEEGEKMKLEDALPNGFLERVGEKGMVVENWAPQIKILNHTSIGGFVSHCGWGSVMESITFGVPIIAMPMHMDQPWNARLVEELGIGLEIKRDNDNGKLQRGNVGKIINQVVVEKTGEDIRRKAREMNDCIKSKAEEEVDEVVNELLKLAEGHI
ncbi:UDP-glucosyltransferase 29-like [Ziziphus jujuba]|uniref:Glycosyltransferase n=1 Tax=Ziziphus jujuba TaxID=326968 RepID=A0A6P3YWV2_ZIZJJ|nr:UDP-glucosyltransferase 29-like [Ziziphus jujuba]